MGFLVLICVSWILLDIIGSSSLDSTRASLRTAGYATALEELAPPPVPAGENGAPHFVAAFKLHPDSGEQNETLVTAYEKGFGALSEKEKDRVREILAKSTELFGKVRAGRQLGSCRYPRDYSRDKLIEGMFVDYPELGGAVVTAELLGIRAQAEAEAGRNSEARETVRDILALAGGYRHEPMLTPQLVRLRIMCEAMGALDKCVDETTPEKDLRAWLEIVPDPLSLEKAMELAFQGELASASGFVGHPIPQFSDVVRTGRPRDPGFSILSPLLKFGGAQYLRFLARMIDVSKKPYLQARSEIATATDRIKMSSSFLNRYVLLTPGMSRGLDSLRATQALLVVTRTGLAAEIERETSGRYPERMNTGDPLSESFLLLSKEAISSVGVPHELPEERPTWKLRKLK